MKAIIKYKYVLVAMTAGLLLGESLVAQGKWYQIDSMRTPRDAHNMLLVNGSPLIIGGRTTTTGSPTTFTDWYDPTSYSFIPAGNMIGSRGFFPAVILDSGEVLAIGGYRSGPTRVCEAFDPNTWTWRAVGNMSTSREVHSGTKLWDGQVLVVGGFSGSGGILTAELFDPTTETFRPTGSLNTRRFGHTATLLELGDYAGWVVVMGGRPSGDFTLSSTEWYDPSSETWYEGPSMNQERYRQTITQLFDGRYLITGGYSFADGQTLPTAEIFDPYTLTFTMVKSTMSHGRMDHTATLLPDGRVLVVGGWNSQSVSTVASADIFDPATETFSPAASLPITRHEHAAVLLEDGTVLLTGGLRWDNQRATLRDAYIYVP